jgi:hypothetical protein
VTTITDSDASGAAADGVTARPPFPFWLATVTLTADNVLTADGQPLNGTFVLTPSQPVYIPGGSVVAGPATLTVVNGVGTPIPLVCTDVISPAFTYTITQPLDSPEPVIPGTVYAVSVPHSLGPTVDIATLLAASSVNPNLPGGSYVISVNGVSGAITLTPASIGAAPAASPALTGIPTAPTAGNGTDTAQLATTAFVQNALPALPLSPGNGGTGQGSLQAALDALAAAVTAGQYLRGNGTHVVLSGIQAADVPVLNQNTTGTAGNLGGGAVFPSYVAPQVTALSDGSSVALNAGLGNDFRWTLGGAGHTLAAPSSPTDGQAITIAIKYTGSYTPLFNSVFDFGTGGQPSWSAINGKTDYVGFRYDAALNASAGRWAYQGAITGYTS